MLLTVIKYGEDYRHLGAKFDEQPLASSVVGYGWHHC